MAARRSIVWPVCTGIVAVFLLILALPQNLRSWIPILGVAHVHLGLDLAGGTQLDFRISEDEISDQLIRIGDGIASLEERGGSNERIRELQNQRAIVEQQRLNLIEAIRTVLERRINSLGVSEATITPATIGGEKHLLVECPGVVDVQTCIATVGKTIQLEFKEEFTETTAEYEAEVRGRAQKAFAQIRAGSSTLATIGEDLGDELGIAYQPSKLYTRDDLHKGLDSLWNAKPGAVKIAEGFIRAQGADENGKPVEEDVPGVFIAELLRPRTQTGRTVNEAPAAFRILAEEDRALKIASHDGAALSAPLPDPVISALQEMQPGNLTVAPLPDGSARLLFLRSRIPSREEMEASHILITFVGATGASPSVTRTKEEAFTLAREIRQKLRGGANFTALAKEYSEGTSAKTAGKLGIVGRGMMVPEFEVAAFALKEGQISEPVETPFGIHIIRSDRAPRTTEARASFEEILVPQPDGEARARTLMDRLQRGDVRQNTEIADIRFLFFSLRPSGWKDTTLDGKHFRAASVILDQTTNVPVVQIAFDDEGGKIFQELTKRNVGKRIAIFVGGQLVSAPTVQEEISGGSAVITGSQNVDEARSLAQDLNTGAIPAPIHLSGQRTVEPTLGAAALRTSFQAGLVGIIILMLYMLGVYRILGLLANGALLVYAVIFLAILKLPLFLFSGQYIVLTLAGAAGMILSIGMAVDTNVLVFERVKEELRKGKLLKTAIEVGFEKAWPSIRDSNISTLITCALLFLIGTSIVRGFAITLGMGVLISMLSGILVSRALARRLAETSLAEKTWLFP